MILTLLRKVKWTRHFRSECSQWFVNLTAPTTSEESLRESSVNRGLLESLVGLSLHSTLYGVLYGLQSTERPSWQTRARRRSINPVLGSRKPRHNNDRRGSEGKDGRSEQKRQSRDSVMSNIDGSRMRAMLLYLQYPYYCCSS